MDQRNSNPNISLFAMSTSLGYCVVPSIDDHVNNNDNNDYDDSASISSSIHSLLQLR